MPKEIIVWAPSKGPQKAFIDCPFPLIGYGGARGGGKTDGVLGKYGIKQDRYGPYFNGVFFRQEMPSADDLIDRAREIYEPIGATYNKVERQFTFKKGGRLRFRPLANNDDASKYQGQSLTDAGVEEAGNYPDREPIFKLFGALRSGNKVPTQMCLTFNPGGPGHHWLKQLFIKPAPLGNKKLILKLNNGAEFPYVYIPSKVQNNPFLGQDYINGLHLVGSPELVRAWLEGDFEIHEGSYFPEFGQRHIVSPFSIPKHWKRYLGFDWGYANPFCAVWGAVSSGKLDDGRECKIPKGAIVIYREAWGTKVDNEQIARTIADLSRDDGDILAVADPSIWKNEGGPSINDQFQQEFSRHNFPGFRKADNDRISGWSQVRRRLRPDPALLYFFSTCPYLLDTIPALVMDPRKHEDVDTEGNDHGADALRYMLKERPLESVYEEVINPVEKGVVHIQAYIDQVRKRQNQPRI